MRTSPHLPRFFAFMVVAVWQYGPPAALPAAEPPRARLLSRIDVKDFGAETIRMGDLDADGGLDLLFVQGHVGSRQITCLTAATITGQGLWQAGKPSAENGRIYSDPRGQIRPLVDEKARAEVPSGP